MRLLRWVVLIAVVCVECAGVGHLCAQTKSVPKLKAEPKSLDDKMTWLRESITQQAGFQLGETRLNYEFHGQEPCQLSWRPVTAGDPDLLQNFPGVEQVEELKAVVPESLRVLPMDIRELLAGGTGQANEGRAGVQWKITASYEDGRRLPEEPFGFVFADRETAQRVAVGLADSAGLCRSPEGMTVDRDNDIGCDSTPGLKVTAPVPSAKNAGHLEAQGNLLLPGFRVYAGPRVLIGKFVNNGNTPVSCVFEAGYYQFVTPFAWVRNQYVRLDLPRGALWGEIDFPEFVDALPSMTVHMQCYQQGSMNNRQQSCAELHHPLHMDAAETKPKKP